MPELIHQMETEIADGRIKESNVTFRKLIDAGMKENEVTQVWLAAYRKFRGFSTETDKALAR